MDFKTQSGAAVVLPSAPWRDAVALKNAIHKEMAQSNIAIDLNADISVVVKFVFQVDSSESIYDAIMKCLAKGTYNTVKISEATFEDEKAREDWYDILEGCLKVNYFPFVVGLRSKYNLIFKALREISSQK
jgi:hypothetical protein